MVRAHGDEHATGRGGDRAVGQQHGVGRRRRIAYSAVTQPGGRSSERSRMRCIAAVQLAWQSSSVPMTPPLRMFVNAAWCGWGCHSAISSPWDPSWLPMPMPFALAGPHPKQIDCGA